MHHMFYFIDEKAEAQKAQSYKTQLLEFRFALKNICSNLTFLSLILGKL